MLKATRALISVYDKSEVVEFARGLTGLEIEILSTGGTFRQLQEHDIPVIPVANVTGFPEILGGRVKTLHPRIHGGILADRSRASHASELSEHNIAPIDLVVVNLYPFRETASDPSMSYEQVVEMIDIGGPCMVRAAAKNHMGVVVVVDPEDYPQVLAALEEGDGQVPDSLRKHLAIKAFRHTQGYDAAIASWLENQLGETVAEFPGHLFLDLEKDFEPRYGENPHQSAALYHRAGGPGVFGGFEQLHGKELSFNNLLDMDAARRLVTFTDEPTVAIIKHNNPCGIGLGKSVHEAYQRALECDSISAFGSIVSVNQTVDKAAAAAMSDLFIEAIVAPDFSAEALEQLSRKKALRLVKAPTLDPTKAALDLRSVEGGMLIQSQDSEVEDPASWKCGTQRLPTADEMKALELGWQVVRHVKSNAIVIGNSHQTVGIGAGQMSRVDSCRIAVQKAMLETQGCVAASDAFFPFPDGLEVLADAGVTAVVQPGGSKRDNEVIAAADSRGMAMMLTGERHFRH
jgi:phosphoribosylaminoimidazolecarboxamide formyltransferase/IMP cyclohydrolase